jgi:hypothetical protein
VFARRLLGTSHGRLADGRLRQVEPLRRAMESPAFSHGNKGTQQLEIQQQLILFFDRSYYKVSFL